jgi:hypothetical protein
MALSKKFNFTNNVNDKSPKVYVSVATQKNTSMFTATIQNTMQENDRATITVLFSSPEINYVKNYIFTPSGDNDLITQGYEYLKTLPEFAGAIES